MSKLTEYPAATQFDSGDILIKDGTNGTKKITAENAAADLVSKAVDTTLSQAGKAADAAAVGAELGNLKSDVTNKNNSLKNIVALESESLVYSMQTGKVISLEGIISNASGDAYKVTDYIPVEAGLVVAFKYSRARYYNQNWAFYDAEKKVVETYGKAISGVTAEYSSKLVVPYGAKYLVIAVDETGTNADGQPGIDAVIIRKSCESIDNKPTSAIYVCSDDKMNEQAMAGTNTASKAIGSQGFTVSITSTDYVVSEFSVSDSDIINIRNCQSRYANKMYAFYDVSGLPINMMERIDNNAHSFMMLNVPFGAVKLIVSGYGTYPTVSKVTRLNLNENVWNDKKWACMGDSLTDENNTRATKRYFNYIADKTGINVVNLGVSGTGYMKPYNGGLPFYQRVDTIPTDSDVITIFGSGNDCNLTLGNVEDTGTDTICGCINNTIDGIRARIVGANIGIIAPTPWQQYPPNVTGNKMDLYVSALGEICKRKGVPFLDLYHSSNMLPWEQSFREAFYTRDDGNGTHPDENGHKFFAPRIKAFLETLLM